MAKKSINVNPTPAIDPANVAPEIVSMIKGLSKTDAKCWITALNAYNVSHSKEVLFGFLGYMSEEGIVAVTKIMTGLLATFA